MTLFSVFEPLFVASRKVRCEDQSSSNSFPRRPPSVSVPSPATSSSNPLFSFFPDPLRRRLEVSRSSSSSSSPYGGPSGTRAAGPAALLARRPTFCEQQAARAVGIDLGTTFSCVGVWKNDKVEILTNADGNRTTPSYVSFGDERLIGDAAKNQAARNPGNTVYDAKRLIGRKFDDPEVQQDLKLLSFNVVPNEKGDCMIKVQHKGSPKKFHPEEISSMVLSKMKEVAEHSLGDKVTKAVITVPAYFSDAQRQATKQAGAIAGLEVLRIINEPTAAAIAYGLDKKDLSKILVYDMGGGTFDVSLLEIEDGVFEVKATAGDTRLGGEDFTHGILDLCLQDIKKRYNRDLHKDAKSKRRLWQQCETAKKTLSASQSANIEVDSLFDGIDYSFKLTRSRFENEITKTYIQKSLKCVERVLRDAKVEKAAVDEIVLIGGSTRIPAVQTAISELFGGKEPNKSINPDEAVAYGAAVQAAILSGAEDSTNKLNDLVLVDVTPLSLGLETAGGIMTKLITRNATIPTKKEQIFSTYANNQTSVDIVVYEGERTMARDCNLLGKFRLDGIAPAPRGVPQIAVTFDLDPNGILNVSAVDKASGKKCHVTITNEKGRMSKSDIEKCIADAEKFAEEDARLKKLVEAKNELENFVYNCQRTKEENSAAFSEEETEAIDKAVRETEEWLAAATEKTAEEVEGRQKEVEKLLTPIMVKFHTARQEAPSETSTNDGDAGSSSGGSSFTEED